MQGRRQAGDLACAIALALLGLFTIGIGVASAAPALAIESPAPNSISNDRTPTFSGTTDDPLDEVMVSIYVGTSAEGVPTQVLSSPLPLSEAWSAGPAAPLAEGVYTARASQVNLLGETGESEPPVTFTVDTSSPTVNLNPPPTPSNDTTPSFSGYASDSTPVVIRIYAGSTAKGEPIASAVANHTGGDWSSGEASPALSSGEYTALATQESSLGNPPGTSAPVRFVVDTNAPSVTLNHPFSPSNNTTPSFTGTASDTTTVRVHIYAGSTAEGVEVASAAATGTGAGWSSGNASPALSSGEYTAVATQESSLGNPTGTSPPVTFTVDTSSPSVTLQQPITPSNKTKPSFAGTASDTTPVVVHIYDAEGSEVASATTDQTGGSWAAGNESSLPSGQYSAVASQTSSLGNPPGTSARVDFTIETAPPRVTLDSPAVRSNDTTPSFAGTASDTTPVTVDIYAGSSASGTVVSTATATGTGGSWSSGDASPSLTNGTFTAVAVQQSSLGNPAGSSSPVTFTVDTSAPTVTLEQPVSPSNNTHPSFVGTASDTTPVVIRIYKGSSPGGSVVSSATATGTGGAWKSGNASPSLSTGEYTATASQESSLHNPEGVSQPVTFRVDTNPPVVTLAQPASLSNNTTPTFTGTASDTTPVVVSIFAGSKASGTPVSTATAKTTGGSWTSEAAAPVLVEGSYTAVASQASSLGNAAGTSSPVSFTVHTASPTVKLNQPVSPSNDQTPSFSGTASDTTSVVVRVYEEPAHLEVSKATATVAGGKWSSSAVKPALSSGKHTYTALASQASSLGNPPGTSNQVTFSIDTTAPVVTLDQPVSHSNDATPSFSGTASDTTPITVELFAGTSAKGTRLRTVTATGTGGSWTSAKVAPPLPSGRHTYTAVAVQASSLGNPAGTSNPVTFTVDTEAPTVTLSAPRTPTNQPAPSFTGTTNEASAVVVDVYDESDTLVATARAPATLGNWSSAGASPALRDGRYTAVATQESLFGNHLGESAAVSFTLDTTSPQVAITRPADGSAASGESQVVEGSSGTAPGDLATVTVQLFAGAEVDAGQMPAQSVQVAASGGHWTATLGGLAAGAYAVRAQQADSAGNVATSSVTRFTIAAQASGSSTASGPAASFSWIPSRPYAGEAVSLLSGSTDASSSITGFAWDVGGTGAFAPGSAVDSVSFAAPGKHLVQLRVSDAGGATSVAAATIEVAPRPVRLMRPFPSVRITAARARPGIRIRFLSIRAPAGAKISVKCSGKGCPVKSQSRLASAGSPESTPVEFRRFERYLRPGVTLEIRIVKGDVIGKYTRLTVRRGKLPLRTDACVLSLTAKPIACP